MPIDVWIVGAVTLAYVLFYTLVLDRKGIFLYTNTLVLRHLRRSSGVDGYDTVGMGWDRRVWVWELLVNIGWVDDSLNESDLATSSTAEHSNVTHD